MTHTQRRVKVVRLDSFAGLMAPHVNQTGSTELGTRPREVVTSAFMESLPVNSGCTMKENALENSLIFTPLQILLLLGSLEISHCKLSPPVPPPSPSLHRRPASTIPPPCQERGGNPEEDRCITMPSPGATDSPPPS
jgi:hypothetical protein